MIFVLQNTLHFNQQFYKFCSLLKSIVRRKTEVRRQRKELSYQREQRPPEERKKYPETKTRPEASKAVASSRPARNVEARGNDVAAPAPTTHAAAANPKSIESPPSGSRAHLAVAFGRTTHLPPPQPQRQTKSAPLHRARASSAENLNVSC